MQRAWPELLEGRGGGRKGSGRHGKWQWRAAQLVFVSCHPILFPNFITAGDAATSTTDSSAAHTPAYNG